MKKMMVLFAVLILTCLMAFGSLAEGVVTTPVPPSAEPVDGLRTAFEGTPIKSAAFGDEQAFVLDRDGVLWTWDYRGEPTQLCELPVYSLQDGYYDTVGDELRRLEDAVFYIVEAEGTLYAINTYSGRIGTVDGEGVRWTADFDASCLIASHGWNHYLSVLTAHNGALYILTDREAYGTQVIRIDLTSGSVSIFDAPDAINMCVQGEHLLLICLPWDEATMRGGDMYLETMDPMTGALARLPLSIPAGEDWTIELAASEDAVYLLSNAVFYMSRNDSDFEALQNGPDLATEMRFLPQGAVVYRRNGVSVFPLAETPASTKLVVQGNDFMGDAQETFIAQHPDAMLQILDRTLSASEVADRIRGGDTETDVFIVRVDAAFGTLIDKGFAAPLDDNPVIAASGEKLFPAIRSALTDSQGRLVAYPTIMDVTTWGYNAELWPQHFGDRPMPATYMELFEMIQEFLENDDGDYFFDVYSHPAMVNYVLKAYLTTHGDETVFNSPALRETLALLEKVQNSLRERRLDSWDVYEIYSELDDSYHCLHWRTVAYASNARILGDNDHDFFLTVDGEPGIEGMMYVMIVNPLSEHPELAKEFISLFAQPDMGPASYAILHTDGKPAKGINSWGEEVDYVTEESLAAWRSIAEQLRFGERTLLLGDKMAEQMETLIARYTDGQLTLDRMLEQLDDVARMILNEQ